jgi:DNA-binding transcriptional LysR family regulator
MELRQLRYFVAAAEEEHFGRAAARVHISQPPLSQQIQALEAELDVELFERVGRGVRLTRAGAEFLLHARDVLRQSERAAQMAQRAARGEIGKVAIGFVGSLAFTYVPWLIREFRSRYPDIGLSCMS